MEKEKVGESGEVEEVVVINVGRVFHMTENLFYLAEEEEEDEEDVSACCSALLMLLLLLLKQSI